jgi:hypothetical protein
MGTEKTDNSRPDPTKIDPTKVIDTDSPQSVFDEVKIIVSMMDPGFHFERLESAYQDVVKLYSGLYPGYRQCNTEYHDFRHTMLVVLATARLMHGASIDNHHFTEKGINIGLISALMHDVGYIQTIDDDTGTGAKYTLTHIDRGIEFFQQYYAHNDYFKNNMNDFRDILYCTGMSIEINAINFSSQEIKLIGNMLGTADILGQMGDRLYLEKLLFLYYEFVEGDIAIFKSQLDLLKKTLSFYGMMKERFINQLGNVNKHMISHFRSRWNMNVDQYEKDIERNINYLKFIIHKQEKNYLRYLKRGSVKEKLKTD